MKKENSYFGLMESLGKDRQTAPESILLDGLRKLNVQICDNLIPFMDLFPYFSTIEAVETFQNKMLSNELSRVMEQDTPCLTFVQEHQYVSPDYIPRCVSNKLILDPGIFQIVSSDVFVFKNIERTHMNALILPNISRFIFINEESEWKNMCNTSDEPMHLVVKDGEDYVLEETNGVTDVILQNCKRRRKESDAYISEHEFTSRLLSSIRSSKLKGALVCDKAGSGKTWLMKSVSKQLATRAKKNVVFFIHIHEIFSELRNRNKLLNESESLEIVLNYSCESKLTSFLLQRYAMINNIEITFFMDGFEKLHAGPDLFCIEFLRSLNSFKNVQLIISSRPNMRSFLEQSFKIVSYDIMPLGTKLQIPIVITQPCEKFSGGDRAKVSQESEWYGAVRKLFQFQVNL